MKKHSILLFTTLVLASIIYLSGCGDDSPPATNTAPEFEQETYSFTLAENAASGDEIGSVSATDADENATLTYSITTTQTDFAIDDGNGAVTVAEAATLDFESTTSYTLQVQVSDGTDTDAADITVTITDVNESSPEFAFADNATSYSFSLAADAAVGDEVGKIAATDSDGTAQLTYTLSGKEAANFAITDGTNVASGEEVSVVVAADVDLTSLVSPVKITVTVSDGENPVDTEVEITIAPVGTGTNAAPVFANTSYSFNVASDAADEAVVGTVSATDEDEGAMLTYSLSGTDAGSFAISNTPVASGEEVSITVATNADLPSLTSPVALTVEVSDGTDQVTANVEITIVAGNVAPVFDQTAYTFNVAEGATDGAILGNVSATDSNAGDRLTYSLSGTDADHFSISNTPVASGTDVPVTVAASANLSSLTSPVTLIVTADDDDTPALTATANVEITIIAGNVAPVFDQTDYTFTIAEGATDGAIVGNVSATDFNAGDLLTYTISGEGADNFAIDNTAVASGTDVPITVASGANLPSLSSPVTITVTVADDATPALMATANVEIMIIEGNVAPVFDQTAYTFTVNEDAESGDVVDAVSATDSNAGNLLAYTLSGEGADNFAIDNTAVASGTDVQITVSGTASLDHETTTSYTLEVQASDDASPALTATAEVTINVNNVNDNDPVFTGAPYTFSVDENSPASTVVDVVAATDADGTATIAYRITTTQTDFEMDASTGEIKVASATLDFETTTTSYTLEVEASDGTNTATADVTINVNDLNEAPTFTGAPYTFSVDENSPASTVVDVVAATDADAGTTLQYSITTTQTDFDIDANTGEITVGTSASLDFETTTSYTLEVEASDGATPALTATAEVTINVNDLNEAPMFTGAPYTFSIDENSTTSTVVDMVAATDDAGTTLQYSITTTQTDFDIDSGTGEIKVASASLDFETTTTSYTLEVQASDGATPALTATAEVTINVNDVNDNDPVFGEMAYTFEVAETAESGDEVGTVAATDADAGTTLEYSITNTQTEFDIDATGIITVATSVILDNETDYMLMVQASDGTNTGTAMLNVNILADYDADNDGLIDINTLEQLNAMRWDLDGNGPAAAQQANYDAAFPDAAAFATTPTGYELLRNLDFDATESYGSGALNTAWSTNTGVGWDPIGSLTTPYVAIFDGNNYTISNLYINRSSNNVGLFVILGGLSTVSNLGLVDVDITGGMATSGLAGINRGTITASYVTGAVTGTTTVGGLLGQSNLGSLISFCYATATVTATLNDAGGLIGLLNGGKVIASYAMGNVMGTNNVGGLIGRGSDATITACYATTGTVIGENTVGGMIGWNDGSTVTACYATGAVTGTSNVGGLAGFSGNSGTITASYYNSETTGQSDDTGKGTPQTTSELQTPTAYGTMTSDIYSTWNLDVDNADADDDATTETDDPWDFGTSSQYPVLKVDFNGDGTATVAEFGTQPRG